MGVGVGGVRWMGGMGWGGRWVDVGRVGTTLGWWLGWCAGESQGRHVEIGSSTHPHRSSDSLDGLVQSPAPQHTSASEILAVFGDGVSSVTQPTCSRITSNVHQPLDPEQPEKQGGAPCSCERRRGGKGTGSFRASADSRENSRIFGGPFT